MTAVYPEESASDQRLRRHRILTDLRTAIVTGAIKPGERIRQEELAARFDTSRIPVREALRQLEAEGLVTLVANSGAWAARLNLAECLELYLIRERLEPLAIGESEAHRDDAEIATLADLASAIEAASSLEEGLRLDREFHLLSYRAAGLPRLLAMVERFWNNTQPYRRAYVGLPGTERKWISDQEHRLIVEAVRRRDADDAQRLLYGHIRRTRLDLQRHPELFGSGRVPQALR